MIATYCFVCVCWIFFRAQDFGDANIILQRIIHGSEGIHYIFIFTIIYGLLILCFHVYALWHNNGNGFYPILDLTKLRNKIVICLVVWIILIFSYGGDTAFIYFQF